MTIKVTFFFSAGKYSWTETHYNINALTFQQAINPAAVLANARYALLGQFANLDTVRLSQVPANRQVYDLQRHDWPGSPTLTTLPAVDPQYEPAFVSLLFNLQAITANRNMYIAGFPDDMVSTQPVYPGGYVFTGPYATSVIAFMTILTGQSGLGLVWGFRSRMQVAMQPVVNVGTQAGFGNNMGLSTVLDPGIAAGSEAYVQGFKIANPRVPNLSGAYKVIGVIPPGSGVPTFTTVLGETGNVEPSNFVTFGKIGPLQFQYLPYSAWHLVRVTHRKRGASAGAPRGRSRARR